MNNSCDTVSRAWLLSSLLVTILIVSPAAAANPNAEQDPAILLPAPNPLPEEKRETITIDGRKYPVPAPWAGNRRPEPQLAQSDFKKIPNRFTRDGGTIYILAEAQAGLVEMLTKAAEDGVVFEVESGYRSVGYQKRIFSRMLAQGRSFEDIIRYVAPPGYSEHMFGTAVDFYPSNWRFADTDHYRWLQENAAAFNFVETYSQFNRLKMPWEAWHWNYIGRKHAGRAGDKAQD